MLAKYETEGIERTFERDGVVTANPDVRWIGDNGLNVASLRRAIAKGRKAVEAARGKKVVWKVEAFSTKCDLVVKAAAKLRRLYPSIAFTICPVEFTR
jgi:hypothetical protein